MQNVEFDWSQAHHLRRETLLAEPLDRISGGESQMLFGFTLPILVQSPRYIV